MAVQHVDLPALSRDAAVAALDALVAVGYSASLSATVVEDTTFWRVESRRHGDERDDQLSSIAVTLGLELLTSGASPRFALVASMGGSEVGAAEATPEGVAALPLHPRAA